MARWLLRSRRVKVLASGGRGGRCGETRPDNVVCNIWLQTRLGVLLSTHGIRHSCGYLRKWWESKNVGEKNWRTEPIVDAWPLPYHCRGRDAPIIFTSTSSSDSHKRKPQTPTQAYLTIRPTKKRQKHMLLLHPITTPTKNRRRIQCILVYKSATSVVTCENNPRTNSEWMMEAPRLASTRAEVGGPKQDVEWVAGMRALGHILPRLK